MRRAVRAIILHNDAILLMHRNKFGHEYENLPGGKIEIGESMEDALARELHEETGIKYKNPRLVFIQHSDAIYGDQYIFLCEYVSGEPQLSEESEEHRINQLGQNLFKPYWLPLSDLPKANFLLKELQQHLIRGIHTKWPEKPLEFTSTRAA